MKDVKKKIAIFDGDSIKWIVASASEKRSIIVTHTPSNKQKEFNTRTEFYGRTKKKDGGWIGEINTKRISEGKEPFSLDQFSIEDKQVAEPVGYCLRLVRMYIERILDKLGCTEYVTYLGEGDVFRHNILTPIGRRYKQNREGNIRALLLSDVDDYIMKSHNGVKVRDIEVDDKVAMVAWEGYQMYQATGDQRDDPYIVVSRDKDNAGVINRWFNPDYMEEPIYIEGFGELTLNSKGVVKGHGRKFNYFQCLNGDSSDGYAGRRVPLPDDHPDYNTLTSDGTTKLISYGEKSVYKDLHPLQTDKECWELIIRKYKEWMPEPVTYTCFTGEVITDDWRSWLQKHIDFVHMQRWVGDQILLEDVCSKHGIDLDK